MSARASQVEREARKLAAIDLQIEHKNHNGRSAIDLLQASSDSLATNAANRILSGDLPAARRYAHAYRLVIESKARLRARQIRDRDARWAKQAAEHGIRVHETVRTADGALHAVEKVEGSLLFVRGADDVVRAMWSKNVEVVPLCHDDIAARCSCRPDVSATRDELDEAPAGTLARDRHGATWQLLATGGSFAGMWSCDGAALPAPMDDLYDDVAPLEIVRWGDGETGGAA